MTFQQMRKIDQVVGIPICFGLTLLRKSLGWLSFRGSAVKFKPKKILFIKLIEQGSTILSYDTLKRATAKVGKQNIYFMVFQENKIVLDFLDIVPPENIFSIRLKPIPLFFYDFASAFFKIWRAKIDTVIDMEFYSRAPAIISFLTGAKIRVGLHRYTNEAPYRGDLMTHRMSYNAYIHTAHFFRLLFEAAFENPNEIPLLKKPLPTDEIEVPKFKCTEAERATVLEKLKSLRPQIVNERIILFNANSSDLIPIRKWNSENYVELGRRVLNENPDVSIVFTGAPSEREPIEELVKLFNHERAVSIAGKTTFRELIVLYTLSEILVTNDSGPSLFASMTDIAGVTLFGPETPLLYRPLGENRRTLYANLACSPCVNVYNHRFTPCKNNVCMQMITVDQVHREISSLLQIRSSSPSLSARQA